MNLKLRITSAALIVTALLLSGCGNQLSEKIEGIWVTEKTWRSNSSETKMNYEMQIGKMENDIQPVNVVTTELYVSLRKKRPDETTTTTYKFNLIPSDNKSIICTGPLGRCMTYNYDKDTLEYEGKLFTRKK
jgi:hypothetical protein